MGPFYRCTLLAAGAGSYAAFDGCVILGIVLPYFRTLGEFEKETISSCMVWLAMVRPSRRYRPYQVRDANFWLQVAVIVSVLALLIAAVAIS